MHFNIQLRKIIESMSHSDFVHQFRLAKKAEVKAKFNKTHTHVKLQILGSGTRGVPSSLYISTDHAKYLFNCGEGTQRLAHEHHLRLSKLENVFFTTPTWKNMGGLPGMALTIQDMGVPEINLHGPTGIRDIFDAVKRFVLLERLTVKESDCNEDKPYVDTCMTIRHVYLTKSTADNDSDSEETLFIDDTDYYAHEYKRRNAKRLKTEPEKIPDEIVNQLKRGRIKGCVAYVCKLQQKLGSLNLELCVEKGVTPGPILGKLKSGMDVTLENGTVVKSVDVCNPPTPGPVFIVIECPDEDYLDSLDGNKKFEEYQINASEPENIASFIIHFTPENIMKNPRYIEWMSRFPKNTQHIIINESNNCLNYEGIHRIQHKLHLLHPTIFPMLFDQQPESEKTDKSITKNPFKNLKVHQAKTLNIINLLPLDGLDNSSVVKTTREQDVREALEVDGFLDTLAELQTEINSRSKYLNDSPAYPKIVMLGTGSCVPNKVRNVSGILMRIDEETSLLLDCGEGTSGQLKRFFGPQFDQILRTIKGIYVSHLHADHHLGLVGVLQERKRVTDEMVFLLAPKQIESWLKLFHKKFQHIDDCFSLIPNQCLKYSGQKISTYAYEGLKDILKLEDVCTIEVQHCAHSFAVAWNLKCGKKIVYSGDTRPCQNVVAIGKYCDLLIHEATMEDGLEKEARRKMHSTISEALKIGEDMDAKFTLLTHFSQRYSKMPLLPDEEKILNNVGIAFDNMQFSLSELSLLPLFYPSLRLIFSEFCNLLEERAQRRIWREEREKLKNT